MLRRHRLPSIYTGLHSHIRRTMATKVSYADLDEYKLETKFSKTHVVHRRNTSGPGRWWGLGLGGTEKWERMKDIGDGGHGAVYLERETKTLQLRAVKKLPVQVLKANRLDFRRELHALISVRDVSIFLEGLGLHMLELTTDYY